MTGYGKSSTEKGGTKVAVEIRTLNSKQLDINIRIPSFLREMELELRNRIVRTLIRGKIDFSLELQTDEIRSASEINRTLAKHYFSQLKTITDELALKSDIDYLSMILKMPDIFVSPEEEPGEHIRQLIMAATDDVLSKVEIFRQQEGGILEADFLKRINTIKGLLTKVEPYEKARRILIKERIQKHLNEYLDGAGTNPERIEQEMIYYIEKLDITEEKLRLKKHCNYFINVLHKEDNSGKKLAFVGQEIGREINTLGSKANDADIQQLVVLMKDELEKIKEQLFNIL